MLGQSYNWTLCNTRKVGAVITPCLFYKLSNQTSFSKTQWFWNRKLSALTCCLLAEMLKFWPTELDVRGKCSCKSHIGRRRKISQTGANDTKALLATIDKYGILINQWAWLYQALLEVSLNIIALWISIDVDYWTAEMAVIASNEWI